MRRSRVFLAILLALRAILTSGANLVRLIIQTLQALPLLDTVVATVFAADYVAWSGSGLSTALNGLVTPTLYFVASYTALTHIYSESIFSRFTSNQSERRFKLIAGVLIVIFYESIVFVLEGVYSELNVGLSTFLLPGWVLSAVLITVPAIGLAYALSQPAGGLTAKPQKENALIIGFVYATWESYIESYDGSWFWHWLLLGFIHLIPVASLAVVFYLLGQFYPVFEIVFLVGLLVSIAVPWVSFDETMELFDFETRIADATSVATVNLKGAISVFSLLFGLVAVGYVTLQLFSSVVIPPLGPRRYLSWTQLGVFIATLQYPIFAGLSYVRVADRLPYFIDEWIETVPGPGSASSTQPTGEKPARSRIGILVPAAFVLTAHWYLIHSFQAIAGRIWVIAWPIFVLLLVVRYRSNRPVIGFLGDNSYILLLSLVQMITLWYVGTNPIILSSLLARPDSSSIFSGALEMYLLLCLLFSIAYSTPDVANRIKARWEPETGAERVSSEEYRAMYSYTYLILIVIIPATYFALDFRLGPVAVYLFGWSLLMFILSRFVSVRSDGHTALSEGRTEYVVVSFWAVGLGVMVYVSLFESYGVLFGSVVSALLHGAILTMVVYRNI